MTKTIKVSNITWDDEVKPGEYRIPLIVQDLGNGSYKGISAYYRQSMGPCDVRETHPEEFLTATCVVWR